MGSDIHTKQPLAFDLQHHGGVGVGELVWGTNADWQTDTQLDVQADTETQTRRTHRRTDRQTHK